MKSYIPIVGLEIHVGLKTKSKMFCSCPADWFGRAPNSLTCPVCLGLPGALPVANKKAIEWTILLAKALSCTINTHTKFDRKNYFYPDLPKGYQISQYDDPIGVNGRLMYSDEQSVRIRRVHLEEDTGKLIHKDHETYVDFNRSGVPLVEIVTEPDFRSSDEAKRFLGELHTIITCLEISDADLEKGSMRMEPNISIKITNNQSSIINDNLPNYKVEVKNINSFRFVKQAIDFEVARQTKLLEKDQTPIQETRGYNENKQITFSQRIKEEAHDYRYFPDPDLPTFQFTQQFIDEIVVPELPNQKVARYVKDYKLRYQDAFILTRNKATAAYFEDVIDSVNIRVENYEQKIAALIINKKIDVSLPVETFVIKAEALLKPKETDEGKLYEVITRVIAENPKPVEDYKKGKTAVVMFLVGLVMQEMKGNADAVFVKKSLEEALKK